MRQLALLFLHEPRKWLLKTRHVLLSACLIHGVLIGTGLIYDTM